MDKQGRKTYTREYKLEAVRLAEASQLPMTQIARQLGIHRNMLAKWCKELVEAESGNQERATVPGDEAELQQLRQEVKALRVEVDILKKALAIISREQA